MSEKTGLEAISRRKALSILGLVGALGLTASALVEPEEADAQEAAPATAPAESRPQRRKKRRATRRSRMHNTGKPAAPAEAPKS